MIIGLPRSRSMDESRVGLSPRAVQNLVTAGRDVIVEHNAGKGSGFADEQYERAGGRIVHSLEEAVSAVEEVGRVERQACRRRVEENFTAEQMVEDYVRVYDSIMEKERRT